MTQARTFWILLFLSRTVVVALGDDLKKVLLRKNLFKNKRNQLLSLPSDDNSNKNKNNICRVEFKEGNIFVDDQVWFTKGTPCVRHEGHETCHADMVDSWEHEQRGNDPLGDYMEYSKVFNAGIGSNNNKGIKESWEISYRTYDNDSSTLLFGQHFLDDFRDTSFPADSALESATNGMASWFPSFKVHNDEGLSLGYMELNGRFVGGDNYRIGSLKDINSTSSKDALMSGPIAIFSESCVIVMSTASSFMSSSYLYRQGVNEIGFGVMGSITTVPRGYRTSTILSSFARNEQLRPDGIRMAFSSWGSKLRKLYNTQRPTDVTLKYLQYSTDNGAFYYYKTEGPHKTYQDTILDLKVHADKIGLPFQNWLMDSWWYYKGPNAGVTNWTAMPTIFPNGIERITELTGWDIVAHNRYWSNETQYAIQNGGKYQFAIEGTMALPLEEKFWNDLFEQAKLWGLTVYEQDWLNVQTQSMNLTLQDVNAATTWLTQMGNAAQRHGIPIQYCMSWPRHILQSLEIDYVTQARASDDYQPSNDQWEPLGITSMFSNALGIVPLKDNFWSSTIVQPTDHYDDNKEVASRLQAIVATYSMGSVAPSDKMALLNASLIMKSCTMDGKLLQPDLPAVRTDVTIMAKAGIKTTSNQRNQVWSTMTKLSGYTYTYILAAHSPPFEITEEDLYVSPLSKAKISGTIIWDLEDAPSSSSAFAPSSFSSTLPYSVPETNKTNPHVYGIAPIFSNGWSFLGEADTKWTPVSQDRFSHLTVYGDEKNDNKQSASGSGGFSVFVKGAPGEAVKIWLRTPQNNFISVSCTLPPSSDGRAIFHTDTMSCSPYDKTKIS